MDIRGILEHEEFTKGNIVSLLKSEGEERTMLFRKSADVKEKYIGKKVWFRGLIEFSNVCG